MGNLKTIPRRALSVTDTVASNLGTPGEMRYGADGVAVYKLFKAAVTLSHGQAVMLDQVSGTDGFSVKGYHTAGLCGPPNGINNQAFSQTGTATAASNALATGAYFWGQVKGYGSVLIAATALVTQTPVAFNTLGQAIVHNNATNSAPLLAGRAVAAAGTDSLAIGQIVINCDMA